MSTLIVDALAPGATNGKAHVRIYTCDVDGVPAVGYLDGVVVRPYVGTTDAAGHLEVDLEPSENLSPANLCYAVEAGNTGAPQIIRKGADTETVEEALAGSLDALGGVLGFPGLADADWSDPEDAQVPTYDVSDGKLKPGGPYAADADLTTVTESVDALGETQLTMVQSLVCGGDSRLDWGSIAEGGRGRPYSVGRVAAKLGIPASRVANHARSGSTARWGNYVIFQEFDPGAAAWPYSQRLGLGLVSFGGNDLSAGVTPDTWLEASFKAGLTAAILRMRATRTWHYDDAALVYTGTWPTVLFSSEGAYTGQGAGYRRTTTAASKVTLTTSTDFGRGVEGMWLSPILIAADTGATGEIWVDGVKVADIDAGLGAAAGTAYGHGGGDGVGRRTIVCPRVWIPTTYQDGSQTLTTVHTVEVRFGATVGSGSTGLRFNGFQAEAGPRPPLTVVANVVQIPNPTGLTGYSTPASHDVVNGWIDEAVAVINEADGADYVVIADVDTPLGGTTADWEAWSNKNHFLSDGVHVNHDGAQLYATAVTTAVSEAVQQLGPMTLMGAALDEVDPITEPPAWHVGSGDPQAVLEDWEREPSEFTADGVLLAARTGTWGIDGQGQLYCERAKFARHDVRDSFARTGDLNGSNVEGDVAGAPREWTAQAGSWATNGTVAYVSAEHASADAVATIELGSTTQTIEGQLTQSGAGNHTALVLRWVDANNYVAIIGNNFGCAAYKKVAGVLTNLGTFSGAGIGTHVRVEVGSDNVLRAWNAETGVPSSSTFTLTDAALLAAGTGTKAGLWVANAATPSATQNTFTEFRAGTTLTATSARTAGAMSLYTWDSGETDGVIGVTQGQYADGTLTDVTGGAGISLRVVDDLNGYFLGISAYGYWGLYKVTAGAAPVLLGYWFLLNGPGTRIDVRMEGDRFYAYSNGVQKTRADGSGLAYVEDATHAGTIHGIYSPWQDGIIKSRWRDLRWGDYLVVGDLRRGDMAVDTAVTGQATIAGPRALDGTFADLVDVSTPGHVHDTDEVTGLDDAIDDAIATAIAPITSALDGKASTVHTHAQSDVTGLTAALAALTSTQTALANGQLILSAAAHF